MGSQVTDEILAEIRTAYYVEDESTVSLAQRYGVSLTTIRAWIDRAGELLRRP